MRIPRHDKGLVTQTYNDGICSVLFVRDIAAAGMQPKKAYCKRFDMPYAERTVGIMRYYAAKQAMETIERVLRVQDAGDIDTLCEVWANRKLYRIERVQVVPDVYPRSLDLTLSLIRQGVEEVPHCGDMD